MKAGKTGLRSSRKRFIAERDPTISHNINTFRTGRIYQNSEKIFWRAKCPAKGGKGGKAKRGLMKSVCQKMNSETASDSFFLRSLGNLRETLVEETRILGPLRLE